MQRALVVAWYSTHILPGTPIQSPLCGTAGCPIAGFTQKVKGRCGVFGGHVPLTFFTQSSDGCKIKDSKEYN